MRLCACMILLTSLTAAPAQTELVWKWEKDKPVYLQTVNDLKQRLTILGSGVSPDGKGQRIDLDLTQTTTVRFDLEGTTNEGHFVIKQTFLRAETKGSNGPASSDKHLEGASFMFHLSKEGKVVKLIDHDKLMEKLLENGKGTPIARTVQAVLSEEALRASLEQSFDFLPDKKVEMGATWHQSLERSLGPLGSLKVASKYDLKELKDGVATIEVATTLSDYKTAAADPTLLQVAAGKIESGGGKGTITFDAAAGRMTKLEVEATLKADLTLRSGTITRQTTLEQTQKTTATVSPKNPLELQPTGR